MEIRFRITLLCLMCCRVFFSEEYVARKVSYNFLTTGIGFNFSMDDSVAKDLINLDQELEASRKLPNLTQVGIDKNLLSPRVICGRQYILWLLNYGDEAIKDYPSQKRVDLTGRLEDLFFLEGESYFEAESCKFKIRSITDTSFSQTLLSMVQQMKVSLNKKSESVEVESTGDVVEVKLTKVLDFKPDWDELDKEFLTQSIDYYTTGYSAYHSNAIPYKFVLMLLNKIYISSEMKEFYKSLQRDATSKYKNLEHSMGEESWDKLGRHAITRLVSKLTNCELHKKSCVEKESLKDGSGYSRYTIPNNKSLERMLKHQLVVVVKKAIKPFASADDEQRNLAYNALSLLNTDPGKYELCSIDNLSAKTFRAVSEERIKSFIGNNKMKKEVKDYLSSEHVVVNYSKLLSEINEGKIHGETKELVCPKDSFLLDYKSAFNGKIEIQDKENSILQKAKDEDFELFLFKTTQDLKSAIIDKKSRQVHIGEFKYKDNQKIIQGVSFFKWGKKTYTFSSVHSFCTNVFSENPELLASFSEELRTFNESSSAGNGLKYASRVIAVNYIQYHITLAGKDYVAYDSIYCAVVVKPRDEYEKKIGHEVE